MTPLQTDSAEWSHPGIRRRRWVVLSVLFAVCALLRVGLVERHGLWADEFFSLAMATGHSLEHPADRANPALGDYIEAPAALPPSAYSRYLEHEAPPAGPGRVVRALLLSDASPPLYYLLLYGWTLVLGTSDAALRLFSVAWSLACFPLVGSLAGRAGGRAAVLPACTLFTFSPLCVFYSTEGRMYSLLWFCSASALWLALDLGRQGFRPLPFGLWVAAAVAGLLTHYFFSFVWAALVGAMLLHPGTLRRRYVWAGAALSALLVVPWYLRVPESLDAWRVTGYWLKDRPGDYHPVWTLVWLPWSYFSTNGVWGTRVWAERVNMALFLILAVAAGRKLSWSLFAPPRHLLWIGVLGACLGPVVFDLLRGTYVTAVSRYALAGMPAALVLAGLALGPLRALPRVLLLTFIGLGYLAADVRIYRNATRAYEPFRDVGLLLAERADEFDLVIVHSIPSGVAGVARYMEAGGAAEGVGIASWVGQLGQRCVPEDLQRLAAGRRRVHLVIIHAVGEPAPHEAWLREHAVLDSEIWLEAAGVLSFVPRRGETFSPAEPDARGGR